MQQIYVQLKKLVLFTEAAVRRCFTKQVILKISQENPCNGVSFRIKLQVMSATLVKKRLGCRYFPVSQRNSEGTSFLKNASGRLLPCLVVSKQTFVIEKKIVHHKTCFIDPQKKPPELFCKKSCSQKFHKIHKEKTVPESFFK